MSGYSVIYADPPWKYSFQRIVKNGGFTYPPMATSALAALPVHTVAAKDCALFLWATMPKLPDALAVLHGWGFRYSTTAFVWPKLNPKGRVYVRPKGIYLKGGLRSGTGSWTNSNVEIVLLGVRGSPKRVCKSVKQIHLAPVGKHSAKPELFAEQIERLMGDVPRVEFFTRRKREGWTTTGFDLDGQKIEDFISNFKGVS